MESDRGAADGNRPEVPENPAFDSSNLHVCRALAEQSLLNEQATIHQMRRNPVDSPRLREANSLKQ